MADWTLWIQGSDHLFYSTSRGTPRMWKSVDLAPLAADINGLWGPTNAFKVYVVASEKGVYYWDGASWNAEYDTGGVGGPWTAYNRPDTRTVCGANDDSLVIASGFGDWYEKIVARQGAPGTSWNTEFDPGTNTYQVLNCHCSADGSAAFATLQDWSTYDIYLYARTPGPPGGPGTWASVASLIQDGTNYWMRDIQVVSSTEVYILGEKDDGVNYYAAVIWKWNGSTLSEVYTCPASWGGDALGIWLAPDGSEGWCFVDSSDWPEYDKHIRYNGSTWTLQGAAEVNYVGRDVTAIPGEFSSARSLAYWSYYNRMDASNAWIGNTNYGIPGYTFGCNYGADPEKCRRASEGLGSFGSGSIEISYINHAPDSNPTLWAASNGVLAYSLNKGVLGSWVNVEALAPYNDLYGVHGPDNAFKVYCAIEDWGIAYWNGSWHQELDTSGDGPYRMHTFRPRGAIFCSAADDLVVASSFGLSNQKILARQGAPGTSWLTEFNDTDFSVGSCHGNRAGTAVFAIAEDNTAEGEWVLLERTSGSPGSWAEVARDGDTATNWVSWQQVRVVSATEVYIVGTISKSPDDEAAIWKWDGTTLTKVFESLTDGPWHTHWVDIDFQGLWVARDGSEGWAFIHGDDVATAYEKFVRFNGTTWNQFQAVTVGYKSMDIAQIEGDTDSATASYSSAYGAFDNFNLPVNPGLWPDEYGYGSPPVENYRGIWYPDGPSGAAAIDLIYTDAEFSTAFDYEYRSDESATAAESVSVVEEFIPTYSARSDETVTTIDWIVPSPPGYAPELEEAGGGLPDETLTPDLGGQSQQERWTTPIQRAGLLQEDTSGSTADETETPEVLGPSTSERWTSPIQSAGARQVEPPAAQVDTTELPEVLGESQQERWTTPIQKAGALAQEASGGMPDEVAADLEPPDYMQGFTDGDGNELLGGLDIYDVAWADTTAGSFGNPTTSNHWGGARDGQRYADGVVCGAGDFGTLVGGLRRTSWCWTGSPADPLGIPPPAGGGVALVADDTVRFSGARTGWNTVDLVSSAHAWVLTGDFDVQVSFSNYSSPDTDLSAEFVVQSQGGGNAGTTQFYCYRQGANWVGARIINGAWTSMGSTGGGGSEGKFRITRSSGTVTLYAEQPWNPGVWMQFSSTYSGFNDPVHVQVAANGTNGKTVLCDFHDFTINSGTVSNLAGWARETSSSTRGTRSDMPEDLGVVCTEDTLDLLDLANDKLWMRFNKGANLALHNVAPWRPRRVVFDDGVLLLAFGTGPSDSSGGSGIVIDFTTDQIRLHREAASTVCGGFHGGAYLVSTGAIARRNETRGWGYDDDSWQTPNYRTFDIGIYRTGGYEYRAVATYAGISMFKALRWYMTGAYVYGRPERSTSTEASHIRSCKVDPLTGELFYMDSDNLYSAFKGGGSGWEDAMDGGTFSAATTKALPGTRVYGYEHQFQIVNPYVFVVGYEGVYRMNWPSGSWELFYGKESRSDATHNILPEYDRATSIELASDGGTDLLLIGLRWDAGSYVGDAPLPAQIVAVRLDTNVVWAIKEQALGERPRALAF